jgi:hypothetical protein
VAQELFLFGVQTVIIENLVQRPPVERLRDVIVNRLNFFILQLEDRSQIREICRLIWAERVVGEAMLEKAPVKTSSGCANRINEIDRMAIGYLFDLLWSDIYYTRNTR